MIYFIKKYLNIIGIDKTIAYTISSRIIQAGGGVFILIFIAKYLSKVEQGYYYTFGSILAIQIFFELGLGGIITQFVAHENSRLKWENKSSFSGSEETCSRLSSLLHFAVKWYGVIALFLFIGLLISGFLFFSNFENKDNKIEWQIPWIILSITTVFSLIISPVLAFFEGLGRIKEVAKIRFLQQVLQLVFIIMFFLLGFKLYSAPLASLFAFLSIPVWILWKPNLDLLIFTWKKLDKWIVSYKEEIFPLQWKIALSWISGYFIFQLFNPVLFAIEGPVVAGQMGMTLTVLNAIFSLTFSWISTKVPIFSNLIANKQFEQLDIIFDKTLIQSTLLNGFFLIIFYILIFIIGYINLKINEVFLADRFLSFLPMLLMMFPIFINHIVGSWALYMRCHKKEPLLLQSIIMGFSCSLSTILLGKYFGLIGITLGYFFLSVMSLIWAYFTFINKKIEWHYES